MSLRVGDYFLDYLGDKLHIELSYKNHAGFLSCFILRFMKLEKPVFVIKDFNTALACKTAYIEPVFDKLLSENKVALRCTLSGASFIDVEGQKQPMDEILSYLKDKNEMLLEALSHILYSTIHTELIAYNGTAEFGFYEAQSEHVKVFASGTITEYGDFDLSMKVLISPEITERMPEDIQALFTQKGRGWLGYSMSLSSNKHKPFLDFESDGLKIHFKKVENNGSDS